MHPLFSGVFVYKSFIIKEIFNFFISGGVLYSCVKNYMTTRFSKVVCSFLIIVLTLGYPYNNLLFGFVYLGQTVSIVCSLFFFVNLYLSDKIKPGWGILCMSVLCVGMGVGYTLFIPPVFIALFICILFKNKELLLSKNVKSIIKLAGIELLVFFPATAIILGYVILGPKESALGVGDLVNEGYIYRNLFFDFVLLIPFAMNAVYQSFKTKKFNLFSFLAPALLIYCAIIFGGVLTGRVSTYYYYKLNYLNWVVLGVLGIWSVSDLSRVIKSYLVSFGIVWICIGLFWVSGIDMKLYQKNILYNPFPASDTTYKIYSFNYEKTKNISVIDKGLVELCQYIYNDSGASGFKKSDFVGTWMHLYWYRALCFVEMDTSWCNPHVSLKAYNDSHIEYLLVMRDCDEYRAIEEELDLDDVIFDNGYGFVMKKIVD